MYEVFIIFISFASFYLAINNVNLSNSGFSNSSFRRYIYLFHMSTLILRHIRRGHQISNKDSYESLFDYWEFNSGSLEEQSVLLNGEPSPQP